MKTHEKEMNRHKWNRTSEIYRRMPSSSRLTWVEVHNLLLRADKFGLDGEAIIDSSLSYEENKENIELKASSELEL